MAKLKAGLVELQVMGQPTVVQPEKGARWLATERRGAVQTPAVLLASALG